MEGRERQGPTRDETDAHGNGQEKVTDEGVANVKKSFCGGPRDTEAMAIGEGLIPSLLLKVAIHRVILIRRWVFAVRRWLLVNW